MERSIQYFQNTNYDSQAIFYWTVGYEHKLKNFYNLYLSLDYSSCFEGPTLIVSNPQSNYHGSGLTIVRNHNFTSGIRIPFSLIENRLHISLGTFLKVIKVNRTSNDGVEYYLDKNIDYPYEGYLVGKAYPGFKFQPEIKLAIDVRFLWRVHFYINVGYTKGFSRYQEMSIKDFKINGVPHFDATVYTDGTGFSRTIGLKYDLVPLYKKNR